MKRCYKIEPTNIAKAFGINHIRFIAKLNNPEAYEFKHMRDLANLLNIYIQISIDVFKKELAQLKKKAR